MFAVIFIGGNLFLRIAGKIAKIAKIRTRKIFVPHGIYSSIKACNCGQCTRFFLFISPKIATPFPWSSVLVRDEVAKIVGLAIKNETPKWEERFFPTNLLNTIFGILSQFLYQCVRRKPIKHFITIVLLSITKTTTVHWPFLISYSVFEES